MTHLEDGHFWAAIEQRDPMVILFYCRLCPATETLAERYRRSRAAERPRGPDALWAMLGDCARRLTPSESRIMSALIEAGGLPVATDDLARLLWPGVEHAGWYERQSVRQHVCTLRRKITMSTVRVETSARHGYRIAHLSEATA